MVNVEDNFNVIESMDLDYEGITRFCEDYENVDPFFDYYKFTNLDA